MLTTPFQISFPDSSLPDAPPWLISSPFSYTQRNSEQSCLPLFTFVTLEFLQKEGKGRIGRPSTQHPHYRLNGPAVSQLWVEKQTETSQVCADTLPSILLTRMLLTPKEQIPRPEGHVCPLLTLCLCSL